MQTSNGVDIKVAASVLCFDWKYVGDQVKLLSKSKIDFLHFDLIDGYFAPDYGVGSSIVNSIRKDVELFADFHLMVEDPSRVFDSIDLRQGDLVTIHQEACKNLHRDIMNLKRRGAKVGVALSPATHINTLDYVIEDIDHVLLMTVNPGYKGQSLVNRTISKISELRDNLISLESSASLGVDGNVNLVNIPTMIGNGANFLVAGSSGMFRTDMDLTESIEEFGAAVSASTFPGI